MGLRGERGMQMFDLVGKRRYFFAISIVLILAGVVGFLVNGVELDITFDGGTLINIEMADDNFDADSALPIVKETLNKEATAQKLTTFTTTEGNKNASILQLRFSKSQKLTNDEITKLETALKEKMNVKEGAVALTQNVEPFMGKEMLNKGLLAISITAVLIAIYVTWRFSSISGLSAAVMALLALLHDVFVMFAVYLIFKIPINESFFAAVLTILGYSVNDTIVIYDRMRENTKIMKNKSDVFTLVNTSVIQTLTRTLNTAACVLICVASIYVFAVAYNIQSLKDFSMPMLVGTISGSYSTIFIAGPLWAMWQNFKAKRKATASLKTAKAK